MSCNVGTTSETRRNVSGRPLQSKRPDKDLLDSGDEKVIPRELTPSEVDLIHIHLRWRLKHICQVIHLEKSRITMYLVSRKCYGSTFLKDMDDNRYQHQWTFKRMQQNKDQESIFNINVRGKSRLLSLYKFLRAVEWTVKKDWITIEQFQMDL